MAKTVRTPPVCGDCQWWTAYEGVADWGRCRRSADTPDTRTDRRFVVRANVEGIVLSTRADFGCTQWERKD